MNEPADPAQVSPGARGVLDPGAEHDATGNVTRVVRGDREIFIVGTAHVSQKSVEEVRRVIEELRPDAVCVELDAARHETLMDESRWNRLQLGEILRSGRAGLFLSSLVFSAFQKRLGEAVGARPGAEMLAAIDAARGVGASIVYADRDIQSTLTRCHASLGPVDRVKVISLLATLPFAVAEIDEAQIEQLKQREAIGDAMGAFAKQVPSLKRPLIDERDLYLMASTREAPGKRIVAVVGAAHVAGMVGKLDTPVDLAALTAPPVRTAGSRAASLLIPALVLSVAAVSAVRLPPEAFSGVLTALVMPAVVLAAVLAWASGGSPVSAVAALVLAPLALVTPSAWYGRAVALVQERVRPPTPVDASRLREDVLMPSQFRKNPFLTGLLVGPAVRLGRFLGAVIGLVWAIVRIL
jgi:pheromone shutdown-related protein TraB